MCTHVQRTTYNADEIRVHVESVRLEGLQTYVFSNCRRQIHRIVHPIIALAFCCKIEKYVQNPYMFRLYVLRWYSVRS
jgi:hypothetical protein